MTCATAATCLCRGDLPADGVLEATIFASFEAQITNVHGNVGAFAVGQTICVDQSIVGASILVPLKNGSDAAQVAALPDGGSCVPSYAYTVLLDDAGRPLACNDGVQSELTLDTPKSIDALMATDCSASVCASSSGGCTTSAPAASGLGALACAIAVIVVVSWRRGRPKGSSARRASTR